MPVEKAAGSESAPGRNYILQVHPLIRRNTLLLLASQAISSTGAQMLPTLSAIMVDRLLGSATLAGVGTSMFGISRILVAYPVGKLTDAYGRRVGMVLGYLLSILGAVIIALAMFWSSFLLLLAGMMLIGLGFNARQQFRVATADMYPPSQRGQALGLVLTATLVGSVGGPLLFLAAQTAAPSTGLDSIVVAWLLVPAFFIPGVFLVLQIRPDPKEIGLTLERYFPGYTPPSRETTGQSPTDKVTILTLARHYPKLVAFTTYLSVHGTMVMMTVMTSLILSRQGYPLLSIFIAMSIHGVGMFGPSLWVGWLADTIGRRPVLLAGVVLTGAGSSVIGISESYWIITSSFFLVGVGWSFVNVTAIALLGDTTTPEQRGRAIGAHDTFSGTASITLPFVAGPIAELFGFQFVGVVGVAMMVLPLILLFRLRETSPGRYVSATESAERSTTS